MHTHPGILLQPHEGWPKKLLTEKLGVEHPRWLITWVMDKGLGRIGWSWLLMAED